jgi:DNA-binding response OmpR family regulator
MRVLLAEDERVTAQLLAKGLREQAYAVDLSTTASRHRAASRTATTTSPCSA